MKNPSTRVHAAQFARRQMRDAKVAFVTELAGLDVDPATGLTAKCGDERPVCYAGILESGGDDADLVGNTFGIRDLSVLVDYRVQVEAGDRVRFVSCRYDETLTGKRGTVRRVERDPANPGRRAHVRMDDSK